MTTWFPAKALTGLPGLPGSERNIRARARREGWRSRKAEVGKGVEYHVDALPRPARAALYAGPGGLPEVYRSAPPPAPVIPQGAPTVDALKDWQRDIMHARLAILADLEKRALPVGINPALRAFCDLAAANLLPPALQAVIPQALGKTATETTLSPRTLQRWRAALKKGPASLAPAALDLGGIPSWAAEFMRRHKSTTQDTVAEIIRKMKSDHCPDVPTYDQARRFLKTKVGAVERVKGRKSPNQIRAMLPYIERDFSHLNPGDVINLDPAVGRVWLVQHIGSHSEV